jgi:hypothetical protein
MKMFNWTRADGTPTREWCRDDMRGTHTALPLDASAVPDAVVEKVADGIEGAYMAWVIGGDDMGLGAALSRAAIAALAQALGEVGDE